MSKDDTSTILRKTKFGQKGFIIEDVLDYVDELQTKIDNLEKENLLKDDKIKQLTLEVERLKNNR